TPISETGFIGAAIGAATEGMRPIVELMFVDFFGVCMDQIYNHMAKIHYESGGNVKVPIVLSTAVGGGYSDGAQHSQCLWGTFAHLPGMKRSEEHTSELQSRFDLVCRLLLEKKKTKTTKVNSQKRRHQQLTCHIELIAPTHDSNRQEP